MKSERNNGYLASTVVIEQSADLPESTSQDSISTPNSLQVTYGSRGGTTTSVLQHPIKPQRPIGVTRVTSITRRRRGTVSRQRLLGVLAITLLATCLFILLLLALNTTRECVREPHPNVCMTEECVQTVLEAYIKTNFGSVVNNKLNKSIGCGSITDGTFKLEVNILNFDDDKFLNLNLNKGDKIELIGTMQNSAVPPYLVVNDIKDIHPKEGKMSLIQLIKAVQTPKKRKLEDNQNQNNQENQKKNMRMA